jgi:hypothetical protein
MRDMAEDRLLEAQGNWPSRHKYAYRGVALAAMIVACGGGQASHDSNGTLHAQSTNPAPALNTKPPPAAHDAQGGPPALNTKPPPAAHDAQGGPPALNTKPPPAAQVQEALRYDPADPLSNLEAADVLDRGAARARKAKLVKPAARSCALQEEPRRVWSKPGIASLVAFDTGFVLAGYTRAGEAEQVFVVHVTGEGKLEPIASLPLPVPHPGERVAAPGLAADSAHGVTVAYTDGAGELFMQVLRVGAAPGGGHATSLGKGVDTRFAPAVDYVERGALIAYTLGTTPMRSTLVRIGVKGDVIATHNVTPAGMAAAAPTFVRGASPRALVTADPRNGMSPISRTPLDAEGKPGTVELTAPVGMMSQPPQLSAAQSDFGAYVLYSGMGSAATSAIGLVRIGPKVGAPEAFVKGTAYGALHNAAVALPNAILVAADAPLTPGKQPKHALQLALLDAKGLGPALRVESPSGDATHVALAEGRAEIGVAFSAPDGVYWGTVRCAP